MKHDKKSMKGLVKALVCYFVIILFTTGCAHYMGKNLSTTDRKQKLDIGLIVGVGVSAILWIKYGRDISVMVGNYK